MVRECRVAAATVAGLLAVLFMFLFKHRSDVNRILDRVELLMVQRCANTEGDILERRFEESTLWDFEDGERGYPYEEDEEWNEIRKSVCVRSEADGELPIVTSTTLRNRRVEVPYDLPGEFLIVCSSSSSSSSRSNSNIIVAGALFRNNVVKLLSHVDISRILNVESQETWLWSLDRERNVLLSSSSELVSFSEPLSKDVLNTIVMSSNSRCYHRRNNRTYNKHADLMPLWGYNQDKHKTLRGMFRGHLRSAGEMYIHAGRWHLDTDSSFSYYRTSGSEKNAHQMMSAALRHVKGLLLTSTVAAPLDVHVFEKSTLFPGDDHISFSEKKELITSSSTRMEWPRGHRFECFSNAWCTVLDRVGNGSSGTVYRVRVSLTRKRIVLYEFQNVVMKVFHHSVSTAAKAEATACLHVNARSHPLLQQCLWYSENRTSIHLLFSEYVPRARDLESLISILSSSSSSSSSREDTWKILTSAAEAFDVIHSRGVIHNDVNPRNILVTEVGRTIVVDFGLAAPIESARRESYRAPIYARAYASPEQHGPYYRPRSDGSSDVWCFALTVLHVWHGELMWIPVLGESYMWTQEKIDHILSLDFNIPKEIRDLLREMLSLNPSNRPSMRRVRDVLSKYGAVENDDVDDEEDVLKYDTTLDALRASYILESSLENEVVNSSNNWKVLSEAYVLLQQTYNRETSSKNYDDDLRALCVYQLARVHEALWRSLGAFESTCGGIDSKEDYDSCFFATASLGANKILSRSVDRFGSATEDFQSRVEMLDSWMNRCGCRRR